MFAIYRIPKMASDSKKLDKKPIRGPTAEDVLYGFQQLRAEQRGLATKLSEFEIDLNEHRYSTCSVNSSYLYTFLMHYVVLITFTFNIE